MRNAAETGPESLVMITAAFSGYKIVPVTTCFLGWLKTLDVVKWSRSWPHKWRVNSDFRIIKISQKHVLRYGIAVS